MSAVRQSDPPANLRSDTQSDPKTEATSQHFEGDYRPAKTDSPVVPDPSSPLLSSSFATTYNFRLEPLQLEFLMRLADALNTTLELNTLMHRVADLVRAVIDYRIFAILLVNDRTGDLRMRFQTGHTPEVERMRIKLGRGIVGQAAGQRRSDQVALTYLSFFRWAYNKRRFC